MFLRQSDWNIMHWRMFQLTACSSQVTRVTSQAIGTSWGLAWLKVTSHAKIEKATLRTLTQVSYAKHPISHLAIRKGLKQVNGGMLMNQFKSFSISLHEEPAVFPADNIIALLTNYCLGRKTIIPPQTLSQMVSWVLWRIWPHQQ